MTNETLTIETVTVSRTVSGTTVKTHVAVSGIPTGFRITRRRIDAYRAGLSFVKALNVPSHPSRTFVNGQEVYNPRLGVTFVAVFDRKRRQLAAWRAFDLGMTGTHDRHPLLRGI